MADQTPEEKAAADKAAAERAAVDKAATEKAAADKVAADKAAAADKKAADDRAASQQAVTDANKRAKDAEERAAKAEAQNQQLKALVQAAERGPVALPDDGKPVFAGRPGQSFGITGKDFGTSPGSLTINGQNVAPTRWSPTDVRGLLPASAPASGTFVVKSADGKSQSGVYPTPDKGRARTIVTVVQQ